MPVFNKSLAELTPARPTPISPFAVPLMNSLYPPNRLRPLEAPRFLFQQNIPGRDPCGSLSRVMFGDESNAAIHQFKLAQQVVLPCQTIVGVSNYMAYDNDNLIILRGYHRDSPTAAITDMARVPWELQWVQFGVTSGEHQHFSCRQFLTQRTARGRPK